MFSPKIGKTNLNKNCDHNIDPSLNAPTFPVSEKVFLQRFPFIFGKLRKKTNKLGNILGWDSPPKELLPIQIH
jgi:hypothetical protein